MKIVAHRKIYYIFSGVLVLSSALALAFYGLRFGIDFTGGSLWQVKFPDGVPAANVISEKVNPVVGDVTLQKSGENTLIMRFRNVSEADHQKALGVLKEAGNVEEQSFDSIGPTIGKELRKSGITAVALGLIAIMLYIAYAFRKVSKPVPPWQYGLITAGVALFHDVLIPLGAFAFLGKFVGIEISTPFIAAILTVLGFSVHDTIVVFDRTRENLRRFAGEPFEDIVEKSVHQTIGRSVNTSLTVLFAVSAIWYFGGNEIRPFALALFIGIAAGTYSSIFIASTFLVTIQKFFVKRRLR